MLEQERWLLQCLHSEPAELPAGAWERVHARLHEPARVKDRFALWLWWNRYGIAQARWVAAAAMVLLAILVWIPTLLSPRQEVEALSGYAQVVSFAQSSMVDDPLNENTQIILSGWAD